MIKLSTKVQYAVRAVYDIAYYAGFGPVQAREVGRRQLISTRYLEQIFSRLTRAGVLGSKRGPGGGYYLTRPPGEISVGQLYRAVEGPISLVYCADDDQRRGCTLSDRCVTTDVWKELGDQLTRFLDRISIADLCQKGSSREVLKSAPSERRLPGDFACAFHTLGCFPCIPSGQAYRTCWTYRDPSGEGIEARGSASPRRLGVGGSAAVVV